MAVAELAVAELARKILGIPSRKEQLAKEQERLDQEWNRQIRNFIVLGFHEELGLSQEEYEKSFPKFEPQSRKDWRRFDYPLLHEPRINVVRKMQLAGIRNDRKGNQISNGPQAPDKPYASRTHNSNRYNPFKIDYSEIHHALDTPGQKEQFYTLNETVDLFIQYRNFFDFDNVAAIGSKIKSADQETYWIPIIKAKRIIDSPMLWIAIPKERVIAFNHGDKITVAP